MPAVPGASAPAREIPLADIQAFLVLLRKLPQLEYTLMVDNPEEKHRLFTALRNPKLSELLGFDPTNPKELDNFHVEVFQDAQEMGAFLSKKRFKGMDPSGSVSRVEDFGKRLNLPLMEGWVPLLETRPEHHAVNLIRFAELIQKLAGQSAAAGYDDEMLRASDSRASGLAEELARLKILLVAA